MGAWTELRKAVYAYRQLPNEKTKWKLDRETEKCAEKYGELTTDFVVRDANKLIDKNQQAIMRKMAQ